MNKVIRPSVGLWGSLIPLVLIFFAASPSTSETRQHGSHTHGIGTLNIAIDGNEIYAEIHSPAANIVGFEHHPENLKEKDAIASAIQILKVGDKIFEFSPKADCKMTSSKIMSGFDEEHHDEHGAEGKDEKHGAEEGHHEEHEEHGVHTDFEVEYRFTCTKPDNLRRINMVIFSTFPLLEELNTQLLTPKGQTAMVLDHDKISIPIQLDK